MAKTAQEAAEYLNISYPMVRWYLREKKLKGRRSGLVWLIEEKDLDDFKKWLKTK